MTSIPSWLQVGKKVRLKQSFLDWHQQRFKIEPGPPFNYSLGTQTILTISHIEQSNKALCIRTNPPLFSDSDGIVGRPSTTSPDFYFGQSSGNISIFEPAKEMPTTIQPNHRHICPQCGASGDDLIFSFYCSNSECGNYRQ